MSKDIHIMQDTKMIQEIIKTVPDHGNQINIIMVNTINGHDKDTGTAPVNAIMDNEFDLITYVQMFPQSRLRYLVAEAITQAHRRFGSVKETCEFLGISEALYYRYKDCKGDDFLARSNRFSLLEDGRGGKE